MTVLYDKSVAIREMNRCGLHWFKFDETSGNVTDSKGSAVGALYGSPFRVIGWNGEGKAMSFDGVDDWIYTTQKVPLGKISIRLKIKTTQNVSWTNGNSSLLSTCMGSGESGVLAVLFSNGRIGFHIAKGTANVMNITLESTIPINDSQWHDVLFTWDGTTNVNGAKLYIDNMSTPNATGTALVSQLGSTLSTGTLQLGDKRSSTASSPFNPFNGQIDELEIYNDIIDPNFNKSLILHDGEYKKFLLREPYTPSEKKNIKMTSNTVPSPLVASASSIYSASYPAWYAFNGTTNGQGDCWASSGISSPQWLQIKLDYPLKIGSYSITSRNSASSEDVNQTPKDWVLQGSNNGVDFDNLHSVTNEINWITNETRVFNVDIDKEYLYYRQYITSNNGGVLATAVGEFLLYTSERQETKSKWQTVSTTLPASQQFLDKGMDNLSPLLDRRIETLEPMSMTEKNDILNNNDVGKVFSKTIDLKKYMDIRSIRTEVRT